MEIRTLDLGFRGVRRSIASYLVLGPEGPFLIETGPASTLDALTSSLRENGVDPSEIRDVFVTHIHLDHAGAAGWWAGQGARVWVHEVGAPHLVDPSKLLASAGRIYGDKMDSLWGRVGPVAAELVRPLADGDTVRAGGVEVVAIETPGHARHHHVYRVGDAGFTGDAAGIHVPGVGSLDLPSPPPEFDPPAWEASLDRIRSEGFARIYPTHFGGFDDVDARLDALRDLLRSAVEFVDDLEAEGVEPDAIVEAFRRWNRDRLAAEGLDDPMLYRFGTTNPPAMSVAGIRRYLKRRVERPAR